MPPTPPHITDSKATEVLIALRYWARSTNFEPNEQEKAVLTECEELSVKLWKVGITVGGLSGLGAATAMKVAMIQRAAVASAGASLGSAYGQFKANAPCLNNILALGESRSGFMDEMTPPSPLAMQAKRILHDGGAMTLRSIQEAQTQARGSDLRARGGSPESETRAVPNATTGTGSDSPQPDPDWSTSSNNETNERPILPPPSGDSWEAVRQRYRARRAGDDSGVFASDTWSAAEQAAGASASSTEASRRPGRVRRNAYGDEIVTE